MLSVFMLAAMTATAFPAAATTVTTYWDHVDVKVAGTFNVVIGGNTYTIRSTVNTGTSVTIPAYGSTAAQSISYNTSTQLDKGEYEYRHTGLHIPNNLLPSTFSINTVITLKTSDVVAVPDYQTIFAPFLQTDGSYKVTVSDYHPTANVCTGGVVGGRPSGYDFVISESEIVNIIIPDTKGSLTINKSLSGSGYTNGTYTFNITGPNSYANTVTVTTSGGSGSTTVTGLEYGRYIVSEQLPDGNVNDQFEGVTINGAQKQEAVMSESSKTASVLFQNVYRNHCNYTDLRVSKTVSGGLADGTFNFVIVPQSDVSSGSNKIKNNFTATYSFSMTTYDGSNSYTIPNVNNPGSYWVVELTSENSGYYLQGGTKLYNTVTGALWDTARRSTVPDQPV